MFVQNPIIKDVRDSVEKHMDGVLWADWWNTVIARVAKNMNAPRKGSDRLFNMVNGIRIDLGRQGGHTTFAQVFALTIGACVVTPSEAHLKRLQNVNKLFRIPSEHKDLIAVYAETLRTSSMVSRPIEPDRGAEIILKTIDPLVNNRICIIDSASLLPVSELELFRAAEWDLLVELG